MDSFYSSSLVWKSAAFHFWKYKKFFNLRVRKFNHFPKYQEFFSGWIFLFFGLGLKSSISRNKRKYKKFFNIRAKEFHFPKYKNFFSGWIFFVLLRLGVTVRQVALKTTTAIRLHRGTSRNADYIFEGLSIYIQFFLINFFPLLLYISTENRTKL